MALPKRFRLVPSQRGQIVIRKRKSPIELLVFGGEPKAAVHIPKRFIAKAVDRNRIKRQLHAVLLSNFQKRALGIQSEGRQETSGLRHLDPGPRGYAWMPEESK